MNNELEDAREQKAKWKQMTDEQKLKIRTDIEKLTLKIKQQQENNPKFKSVYNFDPEILLNPSHEKFNEIYEEKNDKKDEVWELIKIARIQRCMLITGVFTGYHIVKSVAWRYGYGAHFFYRTRFLTIPIYMGAMAWSWTKRYTQNLEDAGILDYSVKNMLLTFQRQQINHLIKIKKDARIESSQNEQTEVNI